MIDIEVQGWKQIEAFLKTLPDQVASKMLYDSLMAGAKPISDQAKANIRQLFGSSVRYTGTLEKAIARGRTRRTRYAARVDVKLRRAKNNGKTIKGNVTKPYGDDAFYGRFLEFGTSKMAAKPFLLPAATARRGQSIDRFNKTLMQRMSKWCAQNGVTYRASGSTS
ncbi:HK97-gp10 family putative phage morphogenesis protein [Paraburkholderia bannensis]|uniref:HK97-gp10 family putative phage morphogenesis protein n=1 Tax=Paraburkholderia bannensis TaxID=765414 RepID=UPI002AC336C5|nr:HK97-gp10 family putative phage morphogenesis protein [Paraburkholderia bannensis]